MSCLPRGLITSSPSLRSSIKLENVILQRTMEYGRPQTINASTKIFIRESIWTEFLEAFIGTGGSLIFSRLATGTKKEKERKTSAWAVNNASCPFQPSPDTIHAINNLKTASARAAHPQRILTVQSIHFLEKLFHRYLGHLVDVLFQIIMTAKYMLIPSSEIQ